jgi:hypothetical protein
LRIGGYRVIFKKDEKRRMIMIIRIGHRKEIYPELFMNYVISPGREFADGAEFGDTNSGTLPKFSGIWEVSPLHLKVMYGQSPALLTIHKLCV